MKQLFRDKKFVAIISTSIVFILVCVYLSVSSKSDLKKIQQKKESLKKYKQEIIGFANVNEKNLKVVDDYIPILDRHVLKSFDKIRESSIIVDSVSLESEDSMKMVTELNAFDGKVISDFERIGVDVESFDYKLASKYTLQSLSDADKKKEVKIQLHIVKTIMSILQSQGSNLKSIVGFSRIVDNNTVKKNKVKKTNKVINGYEIILYRYKLEIKANNVLSFLKAFADEKKCFIIASLDDKGYQSNIEVNSSNKNSYFTYNNQSISLILTVYDCVKQGDK